MPFHIGHIPAHKGKRTTTTPIKVFAKVQDVKAALVSSHFNETSPIKLEFLYNDSYK